LWGRGADEKEMRKSGKYLGKKTGSKQMDKWKMMAQGFNKYNWKK
jgi:hypothetical protein